MGLVQMKFPIEIVRFLGDIRSFSGGLPKLKTIISPKATPQALHDSEPNRPTKF